MKITVNYSIAQNPIKWGHEVNMNHEYLGKSSLNVWEINEFRELTNTI